MKSIYLLFAICFFTCCMQAQTVLVLTEGSSTSIRGLSVPGKDLIWASGSNGMVARSIDAGKTFDWMQVAGYEKRDFRDIEAFDANTAIIMAVADPAVILKTFDGGKSWKEVFIDQRPGMFLDAMDFSGKRGVVIGDPINGAVFMARTANRGDTWEQIQHKDSCSAMAQGEAFFAASGGNIHLQKNGDPVYVSGGVRSCIVYNETCLTLPLQSGKSTTGANGMAMHPSHKRGIIVGGDFANAKRTDSTAVLFSLDRSPYLLLPSSFPNGYKSGVAYLNRKTIVAAGTSGLDISLDGGQHWKQVSNQGFHVVKPISRKSALLAGSNGRIAVIRMNTGLSGEDRLH